MAFRSILYARGEVPSSVPNQPEFFSDLYLDQVIEAITGPKREYNLTPFFWAPLKDRDDVYYRQEVMQDLENEVLMARIKSFAERMSDVRRYLATVEKIDFDCYKKGWILEAALVYGEAVISLARDLIDIPLKARGLLEFQKWLTNYIQTQDFKNFVVEAKQVKKALSALKYCIIIESGKFKVKRYEGELDLNIEVEKIFEKFRQRDKEGYLVKFSERAGISHIEAKILEFVAKLYPEPFTALDHFCAHRYPFLNETIESFHREIQFYIAYLDFVSERKRRGLPFCYPQVSTKDKEIYVHDGFDLALANVFRHREKTVVFNDFYLKGPERIIVVTGPNQGGKTTFARMFGQLHYLASLGCPVPGREARLFLCDKILTHFEREEDTLNRRGKLEDDLIRIRDLLLNATSDSIFILNEIFTSTSLEDATFLSKEIMNLLNDLDVIGVWVTFLDELASLNEKTVSMVAMVDPQEPTRRTFKIKRRPADGLAYVLSLAQKYRLTYKQIQERMAK